jgi:hypothetical protein
VLIDPLLFRTVWSTIAGLALSAAAFMVASIVVTLLTEFRAVHTYGWWKVVMSAVHLRGMRNARNQCSGALPPDDHQYPEPPQNFSY